MTEDLDEEIAELLAEEKAQEALRLITEQYISLYSHPIPVGMSLEDVQKAIAERSLRPYQL